MNNSIYKPRCVDIAADGAFRGILVGCVWSISFRPGTGINLWALHQSRQQKKEEMKDNKSYVKNTTKGNSSPYLRTTTTTTANSTPSTPSLLSTIDNAMHAADRTGRSALSLLTRTWSYAPPTARYVASNTAAFSIFIAVFNGTMCSSERIRKKSDWCNAFFAGCSAASVFGLRNPNPVSMVSVVLATGAFTGGLYALRPTN